MCLWNWPLYSKNRKVASIQNYGSSWAWRCTPFIPGLRGQRQADLCELEASEVYVTELWVQEDRKRLFSNLVLGIYRWKCWGLRWKELVQTLSSLSSSSLVTEAGSPEPQPCPRLPHHNVPACTMRRHDWLSDYVSLLCATKWFDSRFIRFSEHQLKLWLIKIIVKKKKNFLRGWE